jgi:hypothetical protein
LETTVSGRLRVEVRGVVGLGRVGKDVEGWEGSARICTGDLGKEVAEDLGE